MGSIMKTRNVRNAMPVEIHALMGIRVLFAIQHAPHVRPKTGHSMVQLLSASLASVEQQRTDKVDVNVVMVTREPQITARKNVKMGVRIAHLQERDTVLNAKSTMSFLEASQATVPPVTLQTTMRKDFPSAESQEVLLPPTLSAIALLVSGTTGPIAETAQKDA